MARRDVLTRSKKRKAEQLLRQRQLPEARAAFERISRITPRDPEVWLNLGAVNGMMGFLDEAEAAFRQALVLRDDLAQAHFNLSYLLLSQGRLQAALPHLQTYTRLMPGAFEGFAQLGRLHQDLGQLDEARRAFERAAELNPGDVAVHNNLGIVLQDLGQFDAARASYRKALSLNPRADDAYANLGNLCLQQRAFDEAAEHYQKALTLNPRNAATHASVGHLHASLGQPETAVTCFDEAIRLQPDYPGAHWNRALALLALGRFKAGWEDYEWRFQCPEVVWQMGRRQLHKPQWDGGALAGKTVLVHAEQGFGDTLQFCRYLPMVAQQGGRVVFECPPELVTLMQGMSAIAQLVEQGSEEAAGVAYDVHAPLMSLPRLFGTTLDSIPNVVPYLAPDKQLFERWRGRLNDHQGFKVGLVWSGNPDNWRDQQRSIALSDLAPLAAVAGVRFYSLQRGAAAQQANQPPAGMGLTDLSAELNDFSDTAACIENLDLVISVDTAVAHLAGALGCPVWTLIYTPADWRWLLAREDSPWYPTMRLFRQQAPQQWRPVIEQLAQALRELV